MSGRRPDIGPDGPSSFVLALVAAWYGYMILIHGNGMARFDAWMFAHSEEFRANVLIAGMTLIMLSPFLLAAFLLAWDAAWGALWRALRRWWERRRGGQA